MQAQSGSVCKPDAQVKDWNVSSIPSALRLRTIRPHPAIGRRPVIMYLRELREPSFTGRIDMMSKFYGEMLGPKQVTDEKGWREFAAGGATIACIPARHRPAATVRRLSSTLRMSQPYGKR